MRRCFGVSCLPRPTTLAPMPTPDGAKRPTRDPYQVIRTLVWLTLGKCALRNGDLHMQTRMLCLLIWQDCQVGGTVLLTSAHVVLRSTQTMGSINSIFSIIPVCLTYWDTYLYWLDCSTHNFKIYSLYFLLVQRNVLRVLIFQHRSLKMIHFCVVWASHKQNTKNGMILVFATASIQAICFTRR